MTGLFKGLFVVTLILIITIINFTDGAKSCKDESRSNLKKYHKGLNACYREMKDSLGDEHHDKMGCVVKCALIKEKLIKEDGMVLADEALVKASAVGRVDQENEAKLTDIFVECNKKYGGKLDQSDSLCKGHGDLGTCLQHGIMDVCGGDAPIF